MQMQNGGDLGLLRKILREGLAGLQEGAEVDRVACCWVCRRLLLWVQYADLERVDLRGLAGLVGDLGEPLGRVYPDADARALAAATARVELAAALVAAGGRPDDEPDRPARVVVV
ncbi:MAG: hypothetical protein ACOYBY_16505 [Dermatophilaceae bacterium]